MDDIYKAEIIDHYQNPRNFGDLADADVVVREANASCGDLIELAVKFEGEEIKEIKFKGVGCVISTAAASLLTERVKRMKVIEVIKGIKDEDMIEMLGIEVSPTRMKCATLPLRALQKALRLSAVEVLKAGGVVIFPTDTVWGMGVAADNPAAIKKFYKIKKRETDKPTAILVADLEQAEKLGQFSDEVRKVAERYWPGALTLVVPGKERNAIGLRVPGWPLVQELCRQVGGILAGSANFAGERAPMKRKEINRELGNKVDLVMEGECGGQEASTVLDTTVEPWKVIRQGTVVIR